MAQGAQGRIGVQLVEDIATLSLDNPSQFNALTQSMCMELVQLLHQLAADRQVRAIVLQGTGENFSAGIAIDQIDAVLFDRQPSGTLINHFELLDAALSSCPKPTIAVVRGHCFGGAWALAAACDIQLASNHTKLAITPAKIGVMFPRPGVKRLVQMVGASRAKYLLFSGAKISMEQAERWGMFTMVFGEAELDAQLQRLLGQLRTNSNFTITHSKQAINRLEDTAAGPAEDQYWAQLWEEVAHNVDLVEGRTAFAHKRRPEFSWQLETD